MTTPPRSALLDERAELLLRLELESLRPVPEWRPEDRRRTDLAELLALLARIAGVEDWVVS